MTPAEQRAQEAFEQMVVAGQRQAQRYVCKVCALPPTEIAFLEADLSNGQDSLIIIAARYGVPTRSILSHAAICTSQLSPQSAEESAVQFAHEVTSGLRRTIQRAESILNDLYDEERYDPETGQTTYPNRTIALADSYSRVAKVHGSTLAGLIAHADRKRLAAQLERLEEARQAQHTPLAAQTIENAPQRAPRRSLAHLLKQTPSPLESALQGAQEPHGEDLPDPFA